MWSVTRCNTQGNVTFHMYTHSHSESQVWSKTFKPAYPIGLSIKPDETGRKGRIVTGVYCTVVVKTNKKMVTTRIWGLLHQESLSESLSQQSVVLFSSAEKWMFQQGNGTCKNSALLFLLPSCSWWLSTLGTPQWSHGGPGPVGWEAAAGVPEEGGCLWLPGPTSWGFQANQGRLCKDSPGYERRILPQH